MQSLLPWQTDLLAKLMQRKWENHLPHALLFTGIEGVGKDDFARFFSRLLFCQSELAQQAHKACGECQSCKLLSAGTHPDYRQITSEDGKVIPVDTIRGVSEFLTLKSQLSAMQVVTISPADRMNHQASNSLLKTLEEPTPDTLLILVTHRPEKLLPTIRSRCQTVAFTTPSPDQAIDWLSRQESVPADAETQSRLLALAGGAPLAALKLVQGDALNMHDQMLNSFEQLARQQLDPVGEAGKWTESGASQSIKWLIAWTMDMIRLKSGAQLADTIGEPAKDCGNHAHQARLVKLSENTDITGLFAWLDKLTESARLLDTQVNQQLMMEDLLIGWSRLAKIRQ